jgi:hypothetical protein
LTEKSTIWHQEHILSGLSMVSGRIWQSLFLIDFDSISLSVKRAAFKEVALFLL